MKKIEFGIKKFAQYALFFISTWKIKHMEILDPEKLST